MQQPPLRGPPRLSRPIRAEGPRETGGKGGEEPSIALPPLRPAPWGAPGSGDPAVPAQPLRLDEANGISRCPPPPLPRVDFSNLCAQPRCPPSPSQTQLLLGRRRRTAAPEGRKWLGRGAGAVTPPRRDPGVRQRPARAAPGGASETAVAPGGTREARRAPPPPPHYQPPPAPRADFAALYFNGTTERGEQTAAPRRAGEMGF